MRKVVEVIIAVAIWTLFVTALTYLAGFWQFDEADDPGFTFLSELVLAIAIWLAGAVVTAGVLVFRR